MAISYKWNRVSTKENDSERLTAVESRNTNMGEQLQTQTLIVAASGFVVLSYIEADDNAKRIRVDLDLDIPAIIDLQKRLSTALGRLKAEQRKLKKEKAIRIE